MYFGISRVSIRVQVKVQGQGFSTMLTKPHNSNTPGLLLGVQYLSQVVKPPTLWSVYKLLSLLSDSAPEVVFY